MGLGWVFACVVVGVVDYVGVDFVVEVGVDFEGSCQRA